MQGQVGRIATTQDHALKAVTDKHKHNWTGTTAARVFSKRMVEHNGRKGNRVTGAYDDAPPKKNMVYSYGTTVEEMV
jgi:hypothetical protein